MKTVLFGMLLMLASGTTIAECEAYISHGQYKQTCSDLDHAYEDSIEFTEVSRTGLTKSNMAVNAKKSGQSVAHNHMTHTALPTQPGQIKQLVDYAHQQGCTWKEIQQRTLLVCP